MNMPLFRQALGEDAWNRLAPVVRRHYDISSSTAETKILHGAMEEVYHAPWVKPWLFLARYFNALVPYAGRDVPVEVRNSTDPAFPDTLFWCRTFRFTDGRIAVFSSRMEPGKPGEIVELLRFGVGIRMSVTEKDGALIFTASEHCWKIGARLLGIPNWVMLGDAIIVERAISANELRLDFDIVHPWFGRSFGYRGRFSL